MASGEPGPAVCANCGSALTDAYCAHCGQPARVEIPTVGRFVAELSEKLLAVDGRLALTLRTLLLQPGQLTLDHLAGRRQRYIKPLALYVAVSLLFFLALGQVPGIRISIGPALEIETLGQPVSTVVADTGIAALDQQVARFAALPATVQDEVLRGGMLRQAPRAMLLLVPTFALLLQLLIRRRRYGEHLLFALHLHSFAYLLLMPGLVPWPQPFHDGLNNLLTALLLLYLALALRRVYGGGWGPTVLRVAVIGLAYASALAGAAVMAVVLAL
ncbi:MAG TPA: DUF3667 domain-containing protein [Nevskiaceae bacterium]|nr:DUF3667 domain-containing protein [Nevskiaceae bacterium]